MAILLNLKVFIVMIKYNLVQAKFNTELSNQDNENNCSIKCIKQVYLEQYSIGIIK